MLVSFPSILSPNTVLPQFCPVVGSLRSWSRFCTIQTLRSLIRVLSPAACIGVASFLSQTIIILFSRFCILVSRPSSRCRKLPPNISLFYPILICLPPLLLHNAPSNTPLPPMSATPDSVPRVSLFPSIALHSHLHIGIRLVPHFLLLLQRSLSHINCSSYYSPFLPFIALEPFGARAVSSSFPFHSSRTASLCVPRSPSSSLLPSLSMSQYDSRLPQYPVPRLSRFRFTFPPTRSSQLLFLVLLLSFQFSHQSPLFPQFVSLFSFPSIPLPEPPSQFCSSSLSLSFHSSTNSLFPNSAPRLSPFLPFPPTPSSPILFPRSLSFPSILSNSVFPQFCSSSLSFLPFSPTSSSPILLPLVFSLLLPFSPTPLPQFCSSSLPFLPFSPTPSSPILFLALLPFPSILSNSPSPNSLVPRSLSLFHSPPPPLPHCLVLVLVRSFILSNPLLPILFSRSLSLSFIHLQLLLSQSVPVSLRSFIHGDPTTPLVPNSYLPRLFAFPLPSLQLPILHQLVLVSLFPSILSKRTSSPILLPRLYSFLAFYCNPFQFCSSLFLSSLRSSFHSSFPPICSSSLSLLPFSPLPLMPQFCSLRLSPFASSLTTPSIPHILLFDLSPFLPFCGSNSLFPKFCCLRLFSFLHIRIRTPLSHDRLLCARHLSFFILLHPPLPQFLFLRSLSFPYIPFLSNSALPQSVSSSLFPHSLQLPHSPFCYPSLSFFHFLSQLLFLNSVSSSLSFPSINYSNSPLPQILFPHVFELRSLPYPSNSSPPICCSFVSLLFFISLDRLPLPRQLCFTSCSSFPFHSLHVPSFAEFWLPRLSPFVILSHSRVPQFLVSVSSLSSFHSLQLLFPILFLVSLLSFILVHSFD
ncbi:hypothetical protein C7M84_022736 [Penaeus vannamei]|uniref:Uncharacterized protein n=1 Tax=Penaeus vannamei TaxID=6689 RepID=A0A423U5W0_PENVA|nr:hypothetical protein C7M84_022736 [Penaeus vannamei]